MLNEFSKIEDIEPGDWVEGSGPFKYFTLQQFQIPENSYWDLNNWDHMGDGVMTFVSVDKADLMALATLESKGKFYVCVVYPSYAYWEDKR